MKQPQRTRVMNEFKRGRVDILIATDVAARGIDVNDLDYVFNYDIPPEYRVLCPPHRPDGPGGKSGSPSPLLRQTADGHSAQSGPGGEVGDPVDPCPPRRRSACGAPAQRGDRCPGPGGGAGDGYEFMVEQLTARGYTGERIAAAALSLRFPEPALPAETAGKANRETRREGDQPSRVPKAKAGSAAYGGRGGGHRIGQSGGTQASGGGHHGALRPLRQRSGENRHLPRVLGGGHPRRPGGGTLDTMKGCKICGRPTRTTRLAESEREEGRPARKGSKAAQFAGERIAKRNQVRPAVRSGANGKYPILRGKSLYAAMDANHLAHRFCAWPLGGHAPECLIKIPGYAGGHSLSAIKTKKLL